LPGKGADAGAFGGREAAVEQQRGDVVWLEDVGELVEELDAAGQREAVAATAERADVPVAEVEEAGEPVLPPGHQLAAVDDHRGHVRCADSGGRSPPARAAGGAGKAASALSDQAMRVGPERRSRRVHEAFNADTESSPRAP
jgi:hypothetical protein